jgi:hypothetical protein
MISSSFVVHYTLSSLLAPPNKNRMRPRQVTAYLPRANMTLPFKMYV